MGVKVKGTQNMVRLAKLLSKTHTSWYAWVLIIKHVHLFSEPVPLLWPF